MDLTQITIIAVALLAVSEALALIPVVRANGVFQLIKNLLSSVVTKLKKRG